MKLGKIYPAVDFHYKGAGIGGTDIQGYYKNIVEVACEVSAHDKYQSNRRLNIKEDLERLERHTAKSKYIAVVYEELERSLVNNKNLKVKYPDVQVIRVL